MKIKFLLIFSFIIAAIVSKSQSDDFSSNDRLILGAFKERTASIGVGDIDNDGDIDVLVANGRHWPGQNRVFVNNGKGVFTVSRLLGIDQATSYSTELADFDNDGDLDVAVGNDKAPNNIFVNNGRGNFTKGDGFGQPNANTRNIVVVDIDQDGDQDILITNRRSENEICLNDGTGKFTKNIRFGSKDDSTIDVKVADMDGDGDNDLVLANRDRQQNYVYLNDGDLNFSEKIPFGSGVDNTRSVAVTDINKDGHQDIITANIGGPNLIYFGAKDLSYTKQIEFDSSSDASSSITIGDLNFDGIEDIVIGNFRQPNAAFLSQDNGARWQRSQLSTENSFTYDVLVSDLNGDDKLDILESNSDEYNRFYFNRINRSSTPQNFDDQESTFLVYRRQSLIGEESYSISSNDSSIVVRSLQGENERGRITGVLAEMNLMPDLSPISYSIKRIKDNINIFKMERSGDNVSIWEEDFDVVTTKAPPVFFPLHSNIPAAMEIMLYQYYFKHGDGKSIPTLPRGEVSMVYKGIDVANLDGEEVKLYRYVVEGINWGGRTIWLDENKNLVALVKANTQIREVIKHGYEEAMPVIIAGNVEEQISTLSGWTEEYKEKETGTMALVGADIVDGLSDFTQRDMVMIIKDGRIAEIGKRSDIQIPEDARIKDVTGKTLMPGLWDMHAHSNQVQWAPAYLAGGVTTIRDNGNEIEFATSFRDAIAKKGMLGPDILLAGMTDGAGKRGNGIIRATNAQEAREVVEMYASNGYKQIKIYNSIEPEVLKVLSEEAHKRGLTVTGHIPNAVGNIFDAVDLGMDMFSHTRALYSVLFPGISKGDLGSVFKDDTAIDPELVKTATEYLLEHKIALDPTINISVVRALPIGSPVETVIPEVGRIAYELWEGKRFRAGVNADVSKSAIAKYAKGAEILGDFFRAGVPIVAGTDNIVPVFSLYLEIETYHKLAGLTPLQAIQTATIIPARVMGLDSETGTLEIGKQADIAILDKNPLDNISNIKTVSAVVTNGNYYESNLLWQAADYLPRINELQN